MCGDNKGLAGWLELWYTVKPEGLVASVLTQEKWLAELVGELKEGSL